MDETNTNEVTTEKLVNDLKTVVRDAEDLLRATAGEVGERAREAREKLTAALESARSTCNRLEGRARERAQEAQKLIQDHPYQSVAIAFGVGMILGLLSSRK